MSSFRSIRAAALVLSVAVAACGGSNVAPGTVLSSQVFAIPSGETLEQACEQICLGDAGPGCFECQAETLSDGGPAVLCEKEECGPPATGHF